MGFLIRTAVNALAFAVASSLVPGIVIGGWITLVLAAVVFGVVNAVVRPVVALLSLPLTVLTLGLFALVINAAMLGLTALLLPGMRVAGFWPAFWGAIVVGIVSWIASHLVADRRRPAPTR